MSPPLHPSAARIARRMAPFALLALTVLLGGCAGSSWVSVVPFVLWALSVALVGCAESHGPGDPCCVEADGEGWGRLSSCYCPAGAACNYAPFTDCGGGVCRTTFGLEPGSCDDTPDAGPAADVSSRPDTAPRPDAPRIDAPDALDGSYEPCCETGPDGIGHVSSCFCPAGWACNYGWFVSCGGDTCAFSECPGDAGAVDAADAVDAGASTGAE